MTPLRGGHETLGVRSDADAKEIRAAWRRFAAEHHPDRGGDPATFRAGAEVYRRLIHKGPPPGSADVVFYRRPHGVQVPLAWGRSRLRAFRRQKRVI